MKVNDIKFKYCDDGEFRDYYYTVIVNGSNNGLLVYYGGQWTLYDGYNLDSMDLFAIANKLEELNATTKADKLFGFL